MYPFALPGGQRGPCRPRGGGSTTARWELGRAACLGNLANPHMLIKAANIVSFFLYVLLVLLAKAGSNASSLMPTKL